MATFMTTWSGETVSGCSGAVVDGSGLGSTSGPSPGSGVSLRMASQTSSASGVHTTRFSSCGDGSFGMVRKDTSAGGSAWTDRAILARAVTLARSGSVVKDLVPASSTPISRSGRVSRPVLVTSWIMDDRNVCCRSMRPRSEPSPILRTRT